MSSPWTTENKLPADGRQCPFCATTFSRVDAARRHAKRCPQREGRTVQTRQRGRRPVACGQCSRLKVHCDRRDGGACGRCLARKLSCSFSRSSNESTVSQQSVEATSSPQKSEHDRLPLTYLLEFTDDKQDFVTEKAIGREPDSTLLGPTCSIPPPSSAFIIDSLDLFDPWILLPLDPELRLSSLPESAYRQNDLDFFNFPASWNDRLVTRIELLETDLSKHFRSNNRPFLFDAESFHNLFNVSNIQRFATSFCRKRHYQYPIIHWPTFALEEASLPLLLAVALTGAAYSLHEPEGPEHVIEARKFYQLADSYIFDCLGTKLDRGTSDISATESIQLCQAALLMYALEILPAGDMAMQHKAITKRLPTLICGLRRLAFIGCRHVPSEDWHSFLHREQIIRIVAWTYSSDCLATLSFNMPPGFALMEMTGNLPCSPALWDIDTSTAFESPTNHNRGGPHNLHELMMEFIGQDKLDAKDFENLPLFHLHIMLCALQQHIYNLQATMTLASQTARLAKALQAWRDLWGKAVARLSENDRKLLGVAKHVRDLESLTRRIIEVAISPEGASSRYLQRIPSSSVRDLHEFIRHHLPGQGR